MLVWPVDGGKPPGHLHERYFAIPESHALAFRELCEMAKDMTREGAVEVKKAAYNYWKNIFENAHNK